jgi:hypothetical protein
MNWRQLFNRATPLLIVRILFGIIANMAAPRFPTTTPAPGPQEASAIHGLGQALATGHVPATEGAYWRAPNASGRRPATNRPHYMFRNRRALSKSGHESGGGAAMTGHGPVAALLYRSPSTTIRDSKSPARPHPRKFSVRKHDRGGSGSGASPIAWVVTQAGATERKRRPHHG